MLVLNHMAFLNYTQIPKLTLANFPQKEIFSELFHFSENQLDASIPPPLESPLPKLLNVSPVKPKKKNLEARLDKDNIKLTDKDKNKENDNHDLIDKTVDQNLSIQANNINDAKSALAILCWRHFDDVVRRISAAGAAASTSKTRR